MPHGLHRNGLKMAYRFKWKGTTIKLLEDYIGRSIWGLGYGTLFLKWHQTHDSKRKKLINWFLSKLKLLFCKRPC